MREGFANTSVRREAEYATFWLLPVLSAAPCGRDGTLYKATAAPPRMTKYRKQILASLMLEDSRGARWIQPISFRRRRLTLFISSNLGGRNRNGIDHYGWGGRTPRLRPGREIRLGHRNNSFPDIFIRLGSDCYPLGGWRFILKVNAVVAAWTGAETSRRKRGGHHPSTGTVFRRPSRSLFWHIDRAVAFMAATAAAAATAAVLEPQVYLSGRCHYPPCATRPPCGCLSLDGGLPGW